MEGSGDVQSHRYMGGNPNPSYGRGGGGAGRSRRNNYVYRQVQSQSEDHSQDGILHDPGNRHNVDRPNNNSNTQDVRRLDPSLLHQANAATEGSGSHDVSLSQHGTVYRPPFNGSRRLRNRPSQRQFSQGNNERSGSQNMDLSRHQASSDNAPTLESRNTRLESQRPSGHRAIEGFGLQDIRRGSDYNNTEMRQVQESGITRFRTPNDRNSDDYERHVITEASGDDVAEALQGLRVDTRQSGLEANRRNGNMGSGGRASNGRWREASLSSGVHRESVSRNLDDNERHTIGDAFGDVAAEALQGLRRDTRQSGPEANRRNGQVGINSSGGRASGGRWREASHSSGGQREIAPRKATATQENLPVESSVEKKMPSVPQLVKDLEEKLSKAKVECMICYEIVGRAAPTWSCASCYSVFHLTCIKKWIRAPTSVDLTSTMNASGGNWRCPGCQAVQLSSADELRYTCFCGQVADPPLDYYITPHSCGGPCQKPLGKGQNPQCKHVCTLQCHPGPCPPCTALAPPKSCPCGKTSVARRCSEQRLAPSCGKPCGLLLHCGRHVCSEICHEGVCDRCEVVLPVECFCGKLAEERACGSFNVHGVIDHAGGVFSCKSICSKMLLCGNHRCLEKCHPGDCGECELLPSKVLTCPCGKRSMLELASRRTSCTDPVPLCGQTCGKLLPCGSHSCDSLCHSGPCPPCHVSVKQECRCRSSTQTVPCWKTLQIGGGRGEDGNEEALIVCNRKCGKKKNCGRHRCNNQCCPAADAHLCLLPCGKKLRCGQHVCQELCHSGHCPPCLESTFTELTCACGGASIPPPVPCGTPAPSCQRPCSLPQPCGHSATHTCHYGDCPPCTVPASKECVGNHVVLRNVPCGSRDIKCNKLCGKTRQCGLHACARVCHLPPCDALPETSDRGTTNHSCGQICGAPRRDCQHTCSAICHPFSACPEVRCRFPVSIVCSCGRLSAEVPCEAGGLAGRDDPIADAAISLKLPSPLQPAEGKARVPLGRRKLSCDEECTKLERKRVLADAFGATSLTDNIALDGGLAGSDVMNEIVKREPQWVISVEERFKFLAIGSKNVSAGPIRVHVFSVMTREKREALRLLAERWSLSVNSVGREPRRFLVVHVTSKTKAPIRSLIAARSSFPASGQARPLPFDPSIDMDPRLIVGLFDLPREADVSTLVLRFGGECELVWLNDKNALAVFSDPARAGTALRRVDHASAYHGALASIPAMVLSSRVGSAKVGPRRKNVQESNWVEDAWGQDMRMPKVQPNVTWSGKETPITSTGNPWQVLEQDAEQASSTITTNTTQGASGSNKAPLWSDAAPKKEMLGAATSSRTKPDGMNGGDAAEDWEEAF